MTTFGELLRRYALQQLERAQNSLSEKGLRRRDGVHAARTALRHVRAAIALGRRKLGAQGVAAGKSTRTLCHRLSRLRDAQAAVETLDRLIETEQDDDVRALLTRTRKWALRRRIAVMRDALRKDPDLADIRRQTGVLRDVVQDLAWDGIHLRDLRQALRRSKRRTKRAAKCASRVPRNLWHHRWRRRVRRLRHQFTIVTSVLDQPCSDETPDKKLLSVSGSDAVAGLDISYKALRRRSDALGFENDLVVLQRRIRRDTSFPTDDKRSIQRFLRKKLAR
jgi:nicotinic acid phosphoribosyltransferase